MKSRDLIKTLNEDTALELYYEDVYSYRVRIGERSFDKTIVALKIAMNRISEIINGIEEDWILYEILMQHKNTIHTQIDILIKEKRKPQ